MKNIKPFLILLSALILTSCEIVQETKFEADGSGRYSLGIDLSKMMEMGMVPENSSNKKQLDTLIVFSKFLKEKKDSISKLSIEKQEKIKQLENFSVYLKTDTISKKFELKINYDFDNIADLKKFGDKLKKQEINELNLLSKKTKNKKDDDFPDFNKSYHTTFDRRHFSVKISPEALAKAEKKENTALSKNNPMTDMVKFKIRYLFPYKIKKVNNKKARILSNFKGIELTANIIEVSNNPKCLNIDLEFEKD